MKTKKERKKDKVDNYNLRKSILILSMLICIIIAMITYWIYAYYHKFGTLYLEDKIISYKVDDYIETKGDITYLKNINEDISNDFIDKQEEIINNYNIISIEMIKGIYNAILSIEIVYDDINSYEEVLTLNIDLKNDKLLSNEELLNMIGTNYKDIATNIFNEYIKYPSDSDDAVADAITGEELSTREFNENSEKYIIRIREKLPDIMKLYLQDNKLYYVINLAEIDKVCSYRDENRIVNIKREIGKI